MSDHHHNNQQQQKNTQPAAPVVQQASANRPPLRPDDKRPSLRDRLRGASRRYTVTSDRFHIPEEEKAEGVSFEWKRFTVNGQEDQYYIANLRQQGWEPVDAQDMPNVVPQGYTGPVIKDGQMLMARPIELTEEARKEVEKTSKRQVNDRETQLGISPSGHAPRTAPEIKKEVIRPVPIEE